MNTERAYLFGWAAFGLGLVLRGVARWVGSSLDIVGYGFLGVGLGMLALVTIGFTTDERVGTSATAGPLLYGVLLCGFGLLALGLVELALTF